MDWRPLLLVANSYIYIYELESHPSPCAAHSSPSSKAASQNCRPHEPRLDSHQSRRALGIDPNAKRWRTGLTGRWGGCLASGVAVNETGTLSCADRGCI